MNVYRIIQRRENLPTYTVGVFSTLKRARADVERLINEGRGVHGSPPPKLADFSIYQHALDEAGAVAIAA